MYFKSKEYQLALRQAQMSILVKLLYGWKYELAFASIMRIIIIALWSLDVYVNNTLHFVKVNVQTLHFNAQVHNVTSRIETGIPVLSNFFCREIRC